MAVMNNHIHVVLDLNIEFGSEQEEREMADRYERRVFPYPGDKEAVQDFIEQGGAYGTTIGPKSDRQKAGDDRVSDLQKEKFDREAQKLWLRMQNEALREFHEQGFTPVEVQQSTST